MREGKREASRDYKYQTRLNQSQRKAQNCMVPQISLVRNIKAEGNKEAFQRAQ